MKYEGILFDVDGTLTDVTERLVNPFKLSVEEMIGRLPDDDVIDYALKKLLTQIGTKSPFRLVSIMWQIGKTIGLNPLRRITFLRKVYAKYKLSKNVFVPLSHAEETLRYALDTFPKVGIVTSAERESINHAYAQFPILKDIPLIITDDDVTKPKPHSEPIEIALAQLELDGKDTLYIGDLSTDVMAGQGAGTDTMAVLGAYGEYTGALIEQQKPTYIVNDLKEVHQKLQEFS